MKPIFIENVTKTYRFYAPIYDYLFGAILEPGRRALAEAVNVLRPSTLLEIGVGTGLMLTRYPRESVIVGIDISNEMLAIARKRAICERTGEIKLLTMDAEHLDFPDNHFECITLPYVLSVTPNPERMISEARRVCRKGGTILILNHFSGSRFWLLFERSVSSLAGKIGFRASFRYEEEVLKYDWSVQSVQSVNLFNLSKLIVIRNS